MITKDKTTITVRKEDVKKLNSYKVHSSQPYWEVLKLILEGKYEVRK